jgi:hypothetical protein
VSRHYQACNAGARLACFRTLFWVHVMRLYLVG